MNGRLGFKEKLYKEMDPLSEIKMVGQELTQRRYHPHKQTPLPLKFVATETETKSEKI